MAFIQMSFFSKSLMRTVPVNVVLPVDKLYFPGSAVRWERPYKTLYLLHGVFGSCVDWVNNTRLQRYAEEYELAVVMPSGDNGFYVDQPKSHNFYGKFIGRELVELMRNTFPLSARREDTYIGGLSMGGYGAMRNGLKYPDTFGGVISLSGAFLVERYGTYTNDSPLFIERRDFAESCFGDLEKLPEGDKNPKVLVREIQKAGKVLPRIYMACGTEDSLLPVNEEMFHFLKEHGAEVTYETGPGKHEWDFWDTYIRKAIEWLWTEAKITGSADDCIKD